MPQCTGHARARRKKLFARISSTFIKNEPSSNSSTLESGKMLHGKSTYFYNDGGSRLNYVVPSVCALALLIGGIVAINPDVNQVYADEGDENSNNADTEVIPLADSSISLSFNGTPTLTEEVTAGEVAYITNTFTVNANKQTGFTLQLSAMNGSSTELRGKDNAMATIKGVGENVSPANFANNTWGYSYQENPNTALNPKTIAEGLTYSSMPAYGTEKPIANKTLTGVANENTTYLLAFAAKIGTDSPADHYIGNFLLSVVGNAFNPATYTLTYDGNGDNVSNVPAPDTYQETSVTTSHTFTISSTKPTRSGYTFQGWSDTKDDAVKYQPGGNVTIDKSASTNSKTIYAIWKADVFNGITTMQAMDSTICGNAKPGDEAILEDTRDGKKYYVTRTADGNCWMTQNLAYDGKKKDGATENIGTSCTLSRAENSNAITGAECPSGSWTNSTSNKYFAIGRHEDGKHESQGNFYNWPAATQGGSGDEVQGVCPDRWQLPTSNTANSKSFGDLVNAYSISNDDKKLNAAPLFFQYGGYVSGATLNNVSSRGDYWSSTPYSNGAHAYNLYFYSGSVRPSYSNGRDLGFSVRCVAK